MPTRKEERDRMRQERLAAQQAASSTDRRRLILGYAVAGLIVAAILAGIFVVITGGDDGTDPIIKAPEGGDPANCHVEPLSGDTNEVTCDSREGTTPPALAQGDLETVAEAANCELQLDLEDEGNNHIRPNAEPPDYKTNPPTSGDHATIGFQQADGAYAEKPGDIFVVHSLEHGRVAIQYSPALPEEEQLALKGVFDESPDGMLLFPNPDMPYDVAVTAWTQLIGCDTYEGDATLDAIRDFRDIYRGNGPEAVAIVLSG